MRILHVNQFFGPFGGTERYLSDICSALLDQGHDVAVMCSLEGTRSQDGGPVRVHRVPTSYGIRTSLFAGTGAVRAVLEKEQPEVLHIHNTPFFLGPFLTARMARQAAVVKTVHDLRFMCPRHLSKVLGRSDEVCRHRVGAKCFSSGCAPYYSDSPARPLDLQRFLTVRWEMAVARRFERIIAPSIFVRDELLRNGFALDRIVLIPSFMHPVPALPLTRGIGETVLYVGRIERSKGVFALADALACLTRPHFRATIIGTGPDLPQLRDRLAALGISDRVDLPGALDRDAVAEYYRRARVVVIPSLAPESLPLVGLEALWHGRPVAAFDAGGIADFALDGKTGYLIARGDHRAAARRIDLLLDDAALAGRLGAAGRRLAEQKFGRNAHMHGLIAAYEAAALLRSPPGPVSSLR
jgi:glycosyltransferase involved in cell wall biosynthesis